MSRWLISQVYTHQIPTKKNTPSFFPSLAPTVVITYGQLLPVDNDACRSSRGSFFSPIPIGTYLPFCQFHFKLIFFSSDHVFLCIFVHCRHRRRSTYLFSFPFVVLLGGNRRLGFHCREALQYPQGFFPISFCLFVFRVSFHQVSKSLLSCLLHLLPAVMLHALLSQCIFFPHVCLKIWNPNLAVTLPPSPSSIDIDEKAEFWVVALSWNVCKHICRLQTKGNPIRVLDDFLLCELTIRSHNSLPSVFFLFPYFWETAEEVWQKESKNREMSTARRNPRCCWHPETI